MKRIILISIILLWGDSLMAQHWNAAGDSVLLTLPVEFKTATTILHQPQKIVQPRQDLKAKITQLLPIALAMYIFRDELTEFSNKHDKIAHGALAFGLAHYFGTRFAIGFMLSVELTQADDFGISGRYKDTAGDLAANTAGLLLAWKWRF